MIFLIFLRLFTGNDPLMTFDPLTEHTPDTDQSQVT